MNNLVLEKNENEIKATPVPFNKRVMMYFGEVWLFYLVFFAVVTVMSSVLYALPLLLIVVALHMFEFRYWAKNYIVRITWKNDNIEVEYFEGNVTRIFSGPAAEIEFKKSKTWYKLKGNSVYLAITYRDLKIRQYPFKDFDNNLFDLIIERSTGNH